LNRPVNQFYFPCMAISDSATALGGTAYLELAAFRSPLLAIFDSSLAQVTTAGGGFLAAGTVP
jgi:lipid A disaccharide synthetase